MLAIEMDLFILHMSSVHVCDGSHSGRAIVSTKMELGFILVHVGDAHSFSLELFLRNGG
jgi:hypothetical protein